MILILFIFIAFSLAPTETKSYDIPTVAMSNGVKFPILGLGTALNYDHPEAIHKALDLGYRLIDTAFIYNNEEMIGNALQDYFKNNKKNVSRKNIFITSKLPHFAHKPSDADAYIARQLRSLQTDYIDLYLIHWSMCTEREPDKDAAIKGADGYLVPCKIPLIQTWRVLEKWYKNGTFKSIGLSNFNETQIMKIYEQAEIKPHNYQGESHILFPQTKLIKFLKRMNITFTAYAPIGSRGRGTEKDIRQEGDALSHPIAVELARKYNKTSSQILLRNHIQRGYTAIPKSSNPKHLEENINIFDFKLTHTDMNKMDTIFPKMRLYLFRSAIKSPEFPFKEVVKEFGTEPLE